MPQTGCTNSSGQPHGQAWIMISTILVLGMSPGLALFEAGLIRMKNTVTFVAQIFMGVAILSIMWLLFGFSLSHGDDQGGFIGGFSQSMFSGVSYTRCYSGMQVSEASYATFMMMFAIIAPLLMTGGYAERIPFPAFVCITVLWEFFVYYPVSHWMWGGGWLASNGAKDFAGGVVLHATAGTSCLVICRFIGPRQGHQKDEESGGFPYSNIVTSTVGATILWMGWFGFNAGSALASGSDAVHALFNTHIAACSSTVAFSVVQKVVHKKKFSVVAMMNGAIAGMAGVTPAAGYVTHGSALVLGLILGTAACISASAIRSRMNIDDALDVSSVHGVTGIIGSLYTGFCFSNDLSFQQGSSLLGIIYGTQRDLCHLNLNGGRTVSFTSFTCGDGSLLLWQFVAVLASSIWAGTWTFLIIKFTSTFTSVRASDTGESLGLDLECHGEKSTMESSSSQHPLVGLSRPLMSETNNHLGGDSAAATL